MQKMIIKIQKDFFELRASGDTPASSSRCIDSISKNPEGGSSIPSGFYIFVRCFASGWQADQAPDKQYPVAIQHQEVLQVNKNAILSMIQQTSSLLNLGFTALSFYPFHTKTAVKLIESRPDTHNLPRGFKHGLEDVLSTALCHVVPNLGRWPLVPGNRHSMIEGYRFFAVKTTV